MTTSHLIWYVARSAGLVAWALLALTVLWGLALSTRSMRRWVKPAWVLDLHRGLAGLTVVFLVVHVAAIMMDSYVSFGLIDVLVPLASHWHPVAVAWGVVAMYLLVAVEITSLVRTRLPYRMWRAVHVATIPLFAVATIHGFSAGTDRSSMVVIFVGAAVVVTVASLLCVRAARTSVGTLPREKDARVPAGAR